MRDVRLEKDDTNPSASKHEMPTLCHAYLPSLAARYPGTCRVDLERNKNRTATEQMRKSESFVFDNTIEVWHGNRCDHDLFRFRPLPECRMAIFEWSNFVSLSSVNICLKVCWLDVFLCLPGGCKGTGQSHEDHLFALDVLENVDLLGIKFREELEVSGKLSQRHGLVDSMYSMCFLWWRNK